VVLPRYSRLEDPVEITNAAFVLDHLRQNGSGALSLLRNSMRARKWINGAGAFERKRKDPSELDENAKLDDFETIEACLLWVDQRIVHSNALPLPLDLIATLRDEDVELVDDAVGAARHGITILDFVFLLHRAQQSRSRQLQSDPRREDAERAIAEADELDQRSISRARQLRESSTNWPEGSQKRLAEAVGLIGLDIERWPTTGVAGEAYRVEVAQGVVRHIRGEWTSRDTRLPARETRRRDKQELTAARRGLKSNSSLSQAFSQTVAGLRLVAGRNDAAAAFVDPTRILSDPKSLPSVSTSVRAAKGKDVGQGGGDGQGDGDGDVKVEPEEV